MLINEIKLLEVQYECLEKLYRELQQKEYLQGVSWREFSSLEAIEPFLETIDKDLAELQQPVDVTQEVKISAKIISVKADIEKIVGNLVGNDRLQLYYGMVDVTSKKIADKIDVGLVSEALYQLKDSIEKWCSSVSEEIESNFSENAYRQNCRII
jgi:CheY-specific phosphatase CheX